MKKLEAKDLRNLKHGDIVYRFNNGDFRKLLFVSKMPKDDTYLIFCDGEYLTHLFINPKNDSFKYDWYTGEYDSNFVSNLKIDYLKGRIESIKRIYIDD